MNVKWLEKQTYKVPEQKATMWKDIQQKRRQEFAKRFVCSSSALVAFFCCPFACLQPSNSIHLLVSDEHISSNDLTERIQPTHTQQDTSILNDDIVSIKRCYHPKRIGIIILEKSFLEFTCFMHRYSKNWERIAIERDSSLFLSLPLFCWIVDDDDACEIRSNPFKSSTFHR